MREQVVRVICLWARVFVRFYACFCFEVFWLGRIADYYDDLVGFSGL